VDKKNSDFTRVGTNFVYNLQGRKESKMVRQGPEYLICEFRGRNSEGISGIRGIRGKIGGKSEGRKFRGEKIQRSV
jgi:hypothetical protein